MQYLLMVNFLCTCLSGILDLSHCLQAISKLILLKCNNNCNVMAHLTLTRTYNVLLNKEAV